MEDMKLSDMHQFLEKTKNDFIKSVLAKVDISIWAVDYDDIYFEDCSDSYDGYIEYRLGIRITEKPESCKTRYENELALYNYNIEQERIRKQQKEKEDIKSLISSKEKELQDLLEKAKNYGVNCD